VSQATVYEVAKKAGVSIATVSRVLNTPDRVNESTRSRVYQAIDALGFVPKAEAAARARKMHGRIGVLAPFFTYPSFVARLRGVASALSASPYELAIYNVDSSSRRTGYLASLPVTRRIDGLIVMALPFDEEAADRLIAHDLPTVLIEFSRPRFSSVRIDDALGGRRAAAHLCSIGRTRCAFVGDADVPDYVLPISDFRLEGFRSGLAEHGLDLPYEYIACAPHGLETARRSALALLDLPERPTGIFAASDTQAMGVLQAARDCGLKVPDQLAVVGFDDIDVADYIGLTTIHQPLEESGRVAVDLLLSRLADPSRPAQDVWLPLTLVKRQTA
jgi:DNA-binding LacI/PurR family transcriptional regulator